MKIFDCTLYYDEDLILETRLNILDKYIHKFVICESKFTHSGKEKKLNFNIKKFSKFKSKIIYLINDSEPNNLIYSQNKKELPEQMRPNAMKRIANQREFLMNGLQEANSNDIIMYSDNDEIPNPNKLNDYLLKEKISIFEQKLFYYKFNLMLESFEWFGTKACRKKLLLSPQWLRNIKDKNYPFWRLDTIFSKTKYQDIYFVENGGWHFSYLKTAKNIEKKLTSYLHHREYDLKPIGEDGIQKMINNKKPVYNLKVDSKKNKFDGGEELKISSTDELPNYIKNNLDKYKNWLE